MTSDLVVEAGCCRCRSKHPQITFPASTPAPTHRLHCCRRLHVAAWLRDNAQGRLPGRREWNAICEAARRSSGGTARAWRSRRGLFRHAPSVFPPRVLCTRQRILMRAASRLFGATATSLAMSRAVSSRVELSARGPPPRQQLQRAAAFASDRSFSGAPPRSRAKPRPRHAPALKHGPVWRRRAMTRSCPWAHHRCLGPLRPRSDM